MDPGTVKIFADIDVPRLRYIAEIILGEILGLQWEIVTDKRKLGKNPVINYSQENISGSFKISPDKLLYEKELVKQELTITEWKGLPLFYQTNGSSDFPFDIFAASFFLVTRYEEYLEFEPDRFGRFGASSSFSFRNGFLGIPVVDLWTREFAKSLLGKFRNLAFRRNIFKSILTIDIDQPFAYRGKDVFRSLGGLFLDVSRHTGKAGERYRAITKGEKDPFDVFDYIFDSIENTGTDTRLFLPVGDRSEYDKNPSWQNEDYRELINRIARRFNIGIHPSFKASADAGLLATEVKRLKLITSHDISLSRYHYINFRFPVSFRNLVRCGIGEDFSMGFPDEPGFRAGIARPFFFYDITEDLNTKLRIYPFQIMDATLYQYMKLDPVASIAIIEKMINETRKAGGVFISIWHNTYLLDNDEGRARRKVFQQMLKLQKS